MSGTPRAPLAGRDVEVDQFSAEVGAPLAMSADEVVAITGSGVTSEQLQAALSAHVPASTVTRTINQRLDTALDQLRTFVAATKPTTAAAQASAAYDATRLCARVLAGLIRLHLRRLDAVD